MIAVDICPEVTDAEAKRLLRYLYENGKRHAATMERESSTPDEYEDAKVNLCATLLGVFEAIETLSVE